MFRLIYLTIIVFSLVLLSNTYLKPIEIKETLPFLLLNSQNISEVFVKSADSNVAVIHFIKNFKFHIDKKLGEFTIDQKSLHHKLQKNERLLYLDGVSPKLLIQNDSLIIPGRFFLKKQRDKLVRDFKFQDSKIPMTSFIRILDLLNMYYIIFEGKFKKNIHNFLFENEILTLIEKHFFEQCKLVDELSNQGE